MAYDGFTINGIVRELQRRAIGGRINKIQQTEADEIDLVIKNGKDNNLKLMMSANASLPLVYLTDSFSPAPITAPNFCMLLRKHIGNGRIIDVLQPGFDRIIELLIEHLDEMGDVRRKRLIIELMGRHSNIIFVDDESGRILDAIKRIPLDVSQVRQVLPGMKYESPRAEGKLDPREITEEELVEKLSVAGRLGKVLSGSLNGIASLTANEICFRAGLDSSLSTSILTNEDKKRLWNGLKSLMDEPGGELRPVIYMEDGSPKDYSIVPFGVYDSLDKTYCDSVSEMLRSFYKMKNDQVRISQKTSDLRRIISTAIERAVRKLDLQMGQRKDTEDREKYRIYGELLNTYGYSLEEGARSLTCTNYYDGKEITIPIPEGMSWREASQKYFERFNKKKRTFTALETQIEESKNELEYLNSVKHALQIAETETDIGEIRQELIQSGVIRGSAADRIKLTGKNKGKAAKTPKGKPVHFVSSDGFDIFVGKNNIQNDELTFRYAGPTDMWFHAKQAPGSHVIVRRNRKEEIPDATYLEAARIAAYYSSVKDSPKVEIDYTERKNLKKPPAANPGFVIYHTNYSMMAEPDISGIELVE